MTSDEPRQKCEAWLQRYHGQAWSNGLTKEQFTAMKEIIGVAYAEGLAERQHEIWNRLADELATYQRKRDHRRSATSMLDDLERFCRQQAEKWL